MHECRYADDEQKQSDCDLQCGSQTTNVVSFPISLSLDCFAACPRLPSHAQYVARNGASSNTTASAGLVASHPRSLLPVFQASLKCAPVKQSRIGIRRSIHGAGQRTL